MIYVTERAVFRLEDGGLVLTEIAPGIDIARDIAAHMDFPPRISPALRKMDARIFDADRMNLATGLSGSPRRHPRLTRSQT